MALQAGRTAGRCGTKNQIEEIIGRRSIGRSAQAAGFEARVICDFSKLLGLRTAGRLGCHPPVAPQPSHAPLSHRSVLDRSMNIVGLMKHLLRRDESANMQKNIFRVAARHESSSESQIGP